MRPACSHEAWCSGRAQRDAAQAFACHVRHFCGARSFRGERQSAEGNEMCAMRAVRESCPSTSSLPSRPPPVLVVFYYDALFILMLGAQRRDEASVFRDKARAAAVRQTPPCWRVQFPRCAEVQECRRYHARHVRYADSSASDISICLICAICAMPAPYAKPAVYILCLCKTALAIATRAAARVCTRDARDMSATRWRCSE